MIQAGPNRDEALSKDLGKHDDVFRPVDDSRESRPLHHQNPQGKSLNPPPPPPPPPSPPRVHALFQAKP